MITLDIHSFTDLSVDQVLNRCQICIIYCRHSVCATAQRGYYVITTCVCVCVCVCVFVCVRACVRACVCIISIIAALLNDADA